MIGSLLNWFKLIKLIEIKRMTEAKTYRFELDKSSKKVVCPQCRQRRFVLYRDNETRDLLPEHVGRCDRENGCGYHYSPKQYFAENGNQLQKKPFIEISKPAEPIKIDFLPIEILNKSVDPKHYKRNNFYQFITTLFGYGIARELFHKYLIGTSGYWKGSVLFPQIDQQGNLRQIKLMLHDSITGKRIKEGAIVERLDRLSKKYITEITEKSCSLIYGRFIDENFKDLNLEQTFFGCHLLSEYPNKPVCIVESEKTALIASVYMPGFIWMATGGASGCKWRDYSTYKVLQGRSVTFFPDHGFFNKKTEKTCFQEWTDRVARISEALQNPRIRVSDVLEKRLKDQPCNDQDLADLLLIRDQSTGLALSAAGYPIIFDYKASLN
jgi:DNA-directed RNA polymerase subunit RPC12/RpoP